MQKIFELGLKDLAKMCEALDLKNKQGIYLLSGDLASGKTSFVKKAAEYLGYKNAVTSPTFLVMQKYGERIFHYDIYQKNLEELLQLGFLEEIITSRSEKKEETTKRKAKNSEIERFFDD